MLRGIRLRRRFDDGQEPKYKYLDKFQAVGALGIRAEEISGNPDKPCVAYIKDETGSRELALIELFDGVLPMMWRVFSPNKESFTDWILDKDQDQYKDLTSVLPAPVGDDDSSEADRDGLHCLGGNPKRFELDFGVEEVATTTTTVSETKSKS